jgi:uncharacterized protein YceK
VPSRFWRLLWGVAFLQTGCGTVWNLEAPPPPGLPCIEIGPSTCFPMGGVTRSACLGMIGIPIGLATGIAGDSLEDRGNGLLLAGAATVSLIDVPLSLVGDLVTLPVAYARYQGAPWATWWGEQAKSRTGLGLPIKEDPPAAVSPSAQGEPTPEAGQSSSPEDAPEPKPAEPASPTTDLPSAPREP